MLETAFYCKNQMFAARFSCGFVGLLRGFAVNDKHRPTYRGGGVAGKTHQLVQGISIITTSDPRRVRTVQRSVTCSTRASIPSRLRAST